MLRLCAVVLMLVVCVQAAPAVREKRDMTIAELRELYNTPVMKAERFVRRKESWPSWMPTVPYVGTHSGVRVTLPDDRQFLIHKGNDFGSASETVVTDAKYMSSTWKKKGGDTLCFGGAVKVGDMVRAGGEKYSLWKLQYCHRATNAMMDLC